MEFGELLGKLVKQIELRERQRESMSKDLLTMLLEHIAFHKRQVLRLEAAVELVKQIGPDKMEKLREILSDEDPRFKDPNEVLNGMFIDDDKIPVL